MGTKVNKEIDIINNNKPTRKQKERTKEIADRPKILPELHTQVHHTHIRELLN